MGPSGNLTGMFREMSGTLKSFKKRGANLQLHGMDAHTHIYIYIVYVFFSACFCGGVSFCDTRIVFVVFLALATAGSYIKHTHTKLYIVRCHVVDW